MKWQFFITSFRSKEIGNGILLHVSELYIVFYQETRLKILENFASAKKIITRVKKNQENFQANQQQAKHGAKWRPILSLRA